MGVGSDTQWRPTASRENLRLRAAMLRRVRELFDGLGFLEVQTPVLSADTVVDRHIEPFAVILQEPRPSPGGRTLWLQTSPEFAMKRLVAAGATAIYQIAPAFRRDEQGPLHNGEFTMLEWYRVGDGMREGMELLSEVGETLLGRGPADAVSYAEAFRRHVGVNPHAASDAELRDAARSLGVAVPESLAPDDRNGWLEILMSERVEPHLGRGRPTIIYDYPATQAALAKVRQDPGGPSVAERFELYVDGIELANGYHELTDPEVLRRRNAENNAWRVRDGKAPLPEESRLVAAMEAGLPEATGVALGFDRAVMLAAGASRLDEVIPFPMDRA